MVHKGTHFAAHTTAPDIGDSRIDVSYAQSEDLPRHNSIPDPALLTDKDVTQDQDGSDRDVYLHLEYNQRFKSFHLAEAPT